MQIRFSTYSFQKFLLNFSFHFSIRIKEKNLGTDFSQIKV